MKFTSKVTGRIFRSLAATFMVSTAFASSTAMATASNQATHPPKKTHHDSSKLKLVFVFVMPETFEIKQESFDFSDWFKQEFKHELKHEFKHGYAWKDHHNAVNVSAFLHHASFNNYFPKQDDFCYIPPAPVPEPETYALMLGGLGLLGFMARRRKQRG